MDGGESQRTFIYIKDAIEAVLLMIVRTASFPSIFISHRLSEIIFEWFVLLYQENPARANGHIFNVGNPNNEVTVRQLAEMMNEVK